MRKIDKSEILSTQYKQWEENLGENHPAYTSSNHRFYHDIVFNLFYCQKGVCAYTEKFLCDDNFYSVSNWQDGKYTIANPKFFGALDHFESSLKITKAWLWDNLFMVQKDINDKHKRNLPVDDILKPDRDEYDPFWLFEYDEELHIFIPHTQNLSVELQERVRIMILTLGINHPSIVKDRRNHLGYIFTKIDFAMSTWQEESEKNHQFFTAFEMFKNIKSN